VTNIIRIEDIARHVGEEVTIPGWLYSRTGKGKLLFLQVRDGSGIVQAVLFRPNLPAEVFAAAEHLTQESSFIVTGRVKAEPRAPGIPGGFELDVTGLQVVQVAEEYPITPKEHGIEFLMDHRHLWIRSRKQWALLRIRATVMRAIRDWLDSHGFVEMSAPILTPAAGEGTSTLFEVDYFGEPVYLAQTGQLYNEATIYAFGKVYCFGPTFRAEKSKTRRHLTEFWMVEPEMAYCDLDGLMDIEEQFVSHIVQTVLRERRVELQVLERDTSALERVVPPFPRISYDEALERLAAIRTATEDPELRDQSWRSSSAATLAVPTKPSSPSSSTGLCSSTAIPRSARRSTWSRGPGDQRCARASTCWRRRAMARSPVAASASLTRSCCWNASTTTSCRRRRTAGTLTCVATAACHTAGLG
jgi:asparaginyl-tRNA synthetase